MKQSKLIVLKVITLASVTGLFILPQHLLAAGNGPIEQTEDTLHKISTLVTGETKNLASEKKTDTKPSITSSQKDKSTKATASTVHSSTTDQTTSATQNSTNQSQTPVSTATNTTSSTVAATPVASSTAPVSSSTNQTSSSDEASQAASTSTAPSSAITSSSSEVAAAPETTEQPNQAAASETSTPASEVTTSTSEAENQPAVQTVSYQATPESSTAVQTPTATQPESKNNQLKILNQTIPFEDGGQSQGQAIIDSDHSKVSTWGGAQNQSGNDNQNTHFIGHNPGVFNILFTLHVGDVITATDGNGQATNYTINSIVQVDDQGYDIHDGHDYWDQITGTDGGERITLQTCIDDDTNLVVFANH